MPTWESNSRGVYIKFPQRCKVSTLVSFHSGVPVWPEEISCFVCRLAPSVSLLAHDLQNCGFQDFSIVYTQRLAYMSPQLSFIHIYINCFNINLFDLFAPIWWELDIGNTSAYIRCAHSGMLTLALRARLRCCAALHHNHKKNNKNKKKKKKSPMPEIEPTRKAPIRLSVNRLNHSATESALKFVLG